MRHFLAKRTPRTHFQDLDDYFLIVGNVDCLKNFAVLAPAKLADYLVVVLVPTQTHTQDVMYMYLPTPHAHC